MSRPTPTAGRHTHTPIRVLLHGAASSEMREHFSLRAKYDNDIPRLSLGLQKSRRFALKPEGLWLTLTL